MEINSNPRTLKLKLISWVVLISLTILLIIVLNYVYRLFTSLPKEILAPIIAAFGAVLVAIISSSLTKYWERKKIIEQEQLKQKMQLYEDFMAFWVKDLITWKTEEDPNIKLEKSHQFFIKFIPKLIVWGSDKFIKDYHNFLINFTSSSENNPITIFQKLLIYEKLLYSIRQELGFKNYGLKETDLLSLFITDIRNMFSK